MALDIDISMLIQEVKKRPALYDTSMSEYRDKSFKRKLWDEVCCNVYSESVWKSLTSTEKTEHGKDVQTKWHSLRSCFRREFSAQKNISSGSKRKKKRKYIYFDSLLFLLPFTKTVVNEPSHEIEQSSESSHSMDFSLDIQSIDSEPTKTQMMEETNKSYEEEYFELPAEDNQLLRNKNVHKSEIRTFSDDTDEDEAFFRSLLPYVKEFSSDQKLQLRIELLQTVLKFKRSLNNSRSSIDPLMKTNVRHS